MHLIKKCFVLTGLFFFVGNVAFAQTAEATTTSPVIEQVVTAKTIKVKVKGVGCSRDLQVISANVAKVKGVSVCETLKKGATTTFSVTFNPSQTNEKTIYAAVENTPGCSNQSALPYKVKLK